MTILYVDIGVRFLRDGGSFSPFGDCPIANNVASDRFCPSASGTRHCLRPGYTIVVMENHGDEMNTDAALWYGHAGLLVT